MEITAMRGREHGIIDEYETVVVDLEPVGGSRISEHLVGDRGPVLETIHARDSLGAAC
jgi:hypothetical protein